MNQHQKKFIGITITVTLLLAVGLIFLFQKRSTLSLDYSKSYASGGAQLLNVNEAYFVILYTDLGQIKAGPLYLYSFDSASNKDSFLQLDSYNKFYNGTTSLSQLQNNQIILAGTVLTAQKINNRICLNSPQRLCHAEVLTTLSTSEHPNLHKSILALAGALAINVNAEAELTKPEHAADIPYRCPATGRVPGLAMTSDLYRSMGDSIGISARLLPFVYNTDKYTLLKQTLDKASAALMQAYPKDFTKTTYTTCYSYEEIQTAQTVAAGLYELYKLNANAAIRSYLLSMQTDLAPVFNDMSQSIFQDGFGYRPPDWFGQYLLLSTMFDDLGGNSLDVPFVTKVLPVLFNEQTMSSDLSLCTQPGAAIHGPYPQTYGSWPHKRLLACAQFMGDHDFVVRGMLALYEYVQKHNVCGVSPPTVWKYTCDYLYSRIVASLAWIYNVQNSSPAYINNVAPGSADANQLSPDGTQRGLSDYYAIFLMMEKQGLQGVGETMQIQIDYDGKTARYREIKDAAGRAATHAFTTQLTWFIPPEMLQLRLFEVSASQPGTPPNQPPSPPPPNPTPPPNPIPPPAPNPPPPPAPVPPPPPNPPLPPSALQSGDIFKYTGKPAVYYLTNTQCKQIYTSMTVLNAWGIAVSNIKTVNLTNSYPDCGFVKLKDHTLVKGSSPTIYVVESGKLRPFASLAAASKQGFSSSDLSAAIKLKNWEISLYSKGAGYY